MSPDSIRALGWLLTWSQNTDHARPSHTVDFPTFGFVEPQILPSQMVTKKQMNSKFRKHLNSKDITVPYSHMQGTFLGVLNSNNRYHQPHITKESYGLQRYKRNLDFLQALLKPWKHKCAPCDFRNFEYNPKGSSGAVFKKHGYRTKQDVIDAFPDLFPWYANFQHVYGIRPLERESGKTEILPAKKIEAQIPRTFIFSDAPTTMNHGHLLSGVKSLFMLYSNEFKSWPVRLGVNFVKGNFDKFCKAFDGLIPIEGDCEKWDSRFSRVLQDACYDIYEYLLPEEQKERCDFFREITFDSLVVLPNGQIILVPAMKSGRWDTTLSNCIGHWFILVDHFLDACEEMKLRPVSEYLKMHWNLYSDDHLNGYPEHWRRYLTWERRQAAYARAGQNLHPHPKDKIHNTIIGASFLGAEVVRQGVEYMPQYSKDRLLAILYCRDFNVEDLTEILVSIAPMVNTNIEARDMFLDFLDCNYPQLSMIFTEASVFSGAEALVVGQNYDSNIQTHVNRNPLRSMDANNSPARVNNNTNTTTNRPRRRNRNSNVNNTNSAGSRQLHADVRQLDATLHQMQPAGNRRGSNNPPRNSRPAAAVRRQPTNNRNVLHPGGLNQFNRSQFTKLVSRATQIVAAFLDPREHSQFRFPDGDRDIVCYQSKSNYKLFGAQFLDDSDPPVPVTTRDTGRTFVMLNPLINNSVLPIKNTPASFQLAIADQDQAGDPSTQPWPNYLTPTLMNGRCRYELDPLQSQLISEDYSGSMVKVKPVGASILVSFDGDNFGGGGDIAGICIPSGDYQKRVANDNNTTATNAQSLTYWENYANFSKTCTGKLKKGMYVWWRPDSMEDMLLRTPQHGQSFGTQAADHYEFPCLVVAGQINQSSVANNGVSLKNSMLITTYVNFNYTSNDRTRAGDDAPNDPEACAMALAFMRKLDTSFPNDLHDTIIKAAIAGVAGFFIGGPAGAALGVLGAVGAGAFAGAKGG